MKSLSTNGISGVD